MRTAEDRIGRAILIALFIAVLCIAALVTHIVVSIKTSLWVLLLAGTLCFPVGIIHGLGVWMGVF
jgi:hypothetical protein